MALIPGLDLVFTKVIPLLAAFIGFSLLVTVHEFGHFIFARLFGIKVPSFSIGMGPVIFKREIWGTNFCLSLLPVGGYVEIAGLAESGQGEQADAQLTGPQSFNDKPFWQKLLVQFGGILFNLGFAYLAYVFLFTSGMPGERLTSLTIIEVMDNSAAAKSGLRANDVILGIGGKTFEKSKDYSYVDFRKDLTSSPSIKLELLRDNKEVKVMVEFDEAATKEGQRLGVSFKPQGEAITHPGVPFVTALSKAYEAVCDQSAGVYYAIKNMFVQKSLKGAGGPVMILNETFRMAQAGFKTLLIFLAFISINLALLNLLPLGALDGGQIMFTVIEFIIRRPIPDMFRLVVNLSSWLFFISIALYLTYFDILRLFWH